MPEEKYVHKISAECISDAARYATYLLRDTIDQGFKPRFGGDLFDHIRGKIGELIFWDEVCNAGIDVVTTPIRAHYEYLHPKDDFVLNVDGKEVQVEVKTANVIKPLDALPSSFRFLLNAAQQRRQTGRLYDWDWVVSVFINTSDLTYRIMGCVEVEHVGVYPIAGSKQGRHYEIPLETLLPIECIWSDCSWKDQ